MNTYRGLRYEQTDKQVIVYRMDGTVGRAGVKNAKDFDFLTLFKLAVQRSGKQILEGM